MEENLKPPFDATMREIEALCYGAAVPEAVSLLGGEETLVTPAPATKSATKLSSTTAFGLENAPSWMDQDKMIGFARSGFCHKFAVIFLTAI